MTQINGKRKFVKRAKVFAKALGIDKDDALITIFYSDEGGQCVRYAEGGIVIFIPRGTNKYYETEVLAHEMVHARQFIRGELEENADGTVLWKGEIFKEAEFMSDEYWHAPWEMEARALEAWLIHKWEKR